MLLTDAYRGVKLRGVNIAKGTVMVFSLLMCALLLLLSLWAKAQGPHAFPERVT